MKKFIFVFILFTITATVSATAQTQVQARTDSQNAYLPPIFSDPHRIENIQKFFPKIDKMYQAYAEKKHIPGYAFGLMVDGKLVFAGNGGYSNLDKKTPADLKALFRIASMTKSFTAMAILKLRAEGKLQLDDPVEKYVPELKNQKLTEDAPPITIRHLLTHSAGFPEDNPWGDRQLAMSNPSFMKLVHNGVSLSNSSGSAFEYSNLGFALLGMVINRVSGMPYQDYIAENIWQPLGMKQIAWDYNKIPPTALALGYRWVDGHWQQEKMLGDGAFGAMGGIFSSLEAFSHYVALFQEAWPARDGVETGPISRSALREMQQAWRFNQLNNDLRFLNEGSSAPVEAYGYGLRWIQDTHKRTYVGHSGGLPGFGSNWFIMPDYGIGVIFFANLTYAPASEINLRVLHMLVKEAKLQARMVPVSEILNSRKKALVQLLPDWNGVEKQEEVEGSKIFANNFFLDESLARRKRESEVLFHKAGKIVRVGPVVAENQLRGYFILYGEKIRLKIRFTLSPEKDARIQEYHIEEIS
jgi:CubicO group peptidase (beta-lactamase class C family)